MDKPFIFINTAMSLDGKISTIEHRQVRISNKEDLERVDRLRADVDAVMVGGGTVYIDDPKLTIKSEKLRRERVNRGLPENPVKIMVGSIRKIRLEGDFLNYGNSRKIIFTREHDQGFMDALRGKAEVYLLRDDNDSNVWEMMDILNNLGIRRVMVEGGGTLNYELLKAGVVDEIYVAVGPMIFGGRDAPTLADGEGLTYDRKIDLKPIDVEKLGDVYVLKYKVLNKPLK